MKAKELFQEIAQGLSTSNDATRILDPYSAKELDEVYDYALRMGYVNTAKTIEMYVAAAIGWQDDEDWDE